MKADEFFFSNEGCPHYPCHPELSEQNCKFCYCPLYFFKCSGNYTFLPGGVKDCSACLKPHTREGSLEIINTLASLFVSFKKSGFPILKELPCLCDTCIDAGTYSCLGCSASSSVKEK